MSQYYPILLALSFLMCALSVAWILPYLRRMAKQPIYSEGPSWHLKKTGTPTMGGLSFLMTGLLCLAMLFVLRKRLFSAEDTTLLLLNFLFALLHGAIGLYDDYKKIKQKQNEGLTPKEKLIYQTILCSMK